MADQEDTKAAEILQRQQALAGNRGTWNQQWEEIARRILPAYAYTFQSNQFYSRQNGLPKTEYMVDATGALALPKFAAAMESMLTPRNQTWHRLQPLDKTLLRNRSVVQWYEAANDVLFRYRYAPMANYASNQHEIYMGLGAFGTSCMYIDKLDFPGTKGLRYRAIHLGEVYFLENHQGIIDTAIRRFPLKLRQAHQKFGDTLPEELTVLLDQPSKQDDDFWFVHEVRPRSEADGYDPQRKDVRGMMYSSTYVSETGKACVLAGGREDGYHTFPYAISRYVVAPGETYGRSPAMLALPSIRVLNELKRTMLKQGHRAVDPVLLAHDDGVLSGFSLKPGALNAGGVTADGRVLVHALPSGNLAAGEKEAEQERLVINDAFLVTLFQILIDTPQMTATEVLERAREKGALLSPTMGRQQSEALGPMIHRELDVLASQRLLPPKPVIMLQAEAEYEAVYDSPLSRAQRAEGVSGFMRVFTEARDIVAVTQDPSILDNFNLDVALPAIADLQAVPVDWMNTPEQKAAIRAERAKANQQKQMVDAAPAMASVAKALPQLKLNGQPPA